jgi:hypothetical protein
MSAAEATAAAVAPKKRTQAPAEATEAKRAKTEAVPGADDSNLSLCMSDSARSLRSTAASFSGAGVGALKIIDDPQSQFLVMITSNAKKSSEANLEKGNNFCVVNFVVLRALKAGFSNTPYEVCVRVCVCVCVLCVVCCVCVCVCECVV